MGSLLISMAWRVLLLGSMLHAHSSVECVEKIGCILSVSEQRTGSLHFDGSFCELLNLMTQMAL